METVGNIYVTNFKEQRILIKGCRAAKECV